MQRMHAWLYLLCVLYAVCINLIPADAADAFCDTVGYGSQSTLCCYVKSEGKCLPSFVVAGTQKSGTTALAAQLAQHPHISFSPRKELHFFDRRKAYDKGVTYYLEKFKYWNRTTLQASRMKLIDNLTMPLFAEATPYYIASRDACKRISETMPEVKLIVLLREPVARAYSEYQMKKRRVLSQNSFIDLIHNNVETVRACLVLHPGNWKSLGSCLPSEISAHDHYNKFVTSLKTLYTSASNKSKGGCSGCSGVSSDNMGQAHKDTGSTSAWAEMILHCFDRYPELPSLTLSNSHDVVYASQLSTNFLSNTSTPRGIDVGRSDGNSSARKKYSLSIEVGHSEYMLSPHFTPTLTTVPSVPEFVSTSSFLSNKRHFHPVRCMGKNAKEELTPLYPAFQQEMSSMHRCGVPELFSGSLSDMDKAIEKCVKVRSGISEQYIYRSLYAIQLYHCMKFIPKEQFLILSSNSLTGNMRNHTMFKIWEFLGISPPEHIRGHAVEPLVEIQNFVTEIFPDFEKTTGWRLKSEYDPLPEDLKYELEAFLQPFNERLDELLGNNFSYEWYV